MIWLFVSLLTTLVPLLLLLLHRHRRRYDLTGKHIWVIGCSRGIGRATALALASRGALVSLSSRNASALSSLHASLRPCNRGLALPLDVTADLATLDAALQSILQVRPDGGLGGLLFNAGINQRNARFADTDTGTLDAILDTNLRAPLRIASLALPALRRSDDAFLCFVSSLSAYRGVPGATVYGASKAGLSSFCQSLAVELCADSDNVSVVCVHPGFVDTPAIRALKHPKPFVVSEEFAAQQIISAIEHRQQHSAFPAIMEYVVMPFAKNVPTPIYNFILSRTA